MAVTHATRVIIDQGREKYIRAVFLRRGAKLWVQNGYPEGVRKFFHIPKNHESQFAVKDHDVIVVVEDPSLNLVTCKQLLFVRRARKNAGNVEFRKYKSVDLSEIFLHLPLQTDEALYTTDDFPVYGDEIVIPHPEKKYLGWIATRDTANTLFLRWLQEKRSGVHRVMYICSRGTHRGSPLLETWIQTEQPDRLTGISQGRPFDTYFTLVYDTGSRQIQEIRDHTGREYLNVTFVDFIGEHVLRKCEILPARLVPD